MPGRKLKLGLPEVAKTIDQMHARERVGWRKTRLLAVKLVARGQTSSAQIAERRVWTARGQRPVVSRQIKYQWDYLYGALSLLGGETHFAHVPGVALEWDESYLRDLTATAPVVTHVLVRDQAGFHLRDGDPRLPAQVRIIDLPPYCPELNPCEQFWDILKDDLANQVFPSIQKLRLGMQDTLRRYWENASAVLSLIGRDWFRVQLNASPKSQMSL